MSRDLGRRQSLILRALAQLKQEEGTGRFYVWSVLEVAWGLGLRQEGAAQQAARRMAEAQWLTGLQVQVPDETSFGGTSGCQSFLP